MSYTLSEIKVAAYNWQELPNMATAERSLWLGLGYCYDCYRAHPENKAACDELAKTYIRLFWEGDHE